MIIALRPLSIGGKDYFVGDTIPDEAILPERIPALSRNGYISTSGLSSVISAEDEKILADTDSSLLITKNKK